MATTEYTIYVGGIPTHKRYSRKEYALAAAVEMEAAREPYQIRTMTGRVVHEYTPAAAKPEIKFDIDTMKDKISKLLAKAEGTDNQAERDAFTTKAEKLMIQLGISAAELEAAGTIKPEQIIESRLLFTDSYAKTMVQFASDVAYGFGNITTLRVSRSQREQVCFVIGHQSDVQTFTHLVNSLVLQAYSALKTYRKTDEVRLSVHDKQYRFVMDRSFLEAYGFRVGTRLKALRVKEEKTASSGAELVLASKQARLQDHMAEAYPDLKKSKRTQVEMSMSASTAGDHAGHTARLGQDEVGKRGELS